MSRGLGCYWPIDLGRLVKVIIPSFQTWSTKTCSTLLQSRKCKFTSSNKLIERQTYGIGND